MSQVLLHAVDAVVEAGAVVVAVALETEVVEGADLEEVEEAEEVLPEAVVDGVAVEEAVVAVLKP